MRLEVRQELHRRRPLEVTEAVGVPLSNYDSQNIRNTLVHHLAELTIKKRWVAMPATENGFAGLRLIISLFPKGSYFELPLFDPLLYRIS